MYIRHSAKFDKDIKIIHPGEYYVSGQDELIGTLLGSCVAVCLIDMKKSVCGMNHFMLPGKITRSDIMSDRKAKYGITAINHLLTSMHEHGCRNDNLVAKIFGGGRVLDSAMGSHSIPEDNIRLANVMLELEDIPIVESDVGGNYTRKLLLEIHSGKVFLKKSTRKDFLEVIAKQEKEYLKRGFLNGKD